jgi:NADH-quinone oxidoreductase subunit M
VNVPVAVFAAVGVLAATLYGLRLVQRAFQGPAVQPWRLEDLSFREMLIVAAMSVTLLWLGLYPRPVLDTFGAATGNLRGPAMEASTSHPGGGK